MSSVFNTIKNASPKLRRRRGKKERRFAPNAPAAAPARVIVSSSSGSARTRSHGGDEGEDTTRALTLRFGGLDVHGIAPVNSPVVLPPSPVTSPTLSPVIENSPKFSSPNFSSPKFSYGDGLLAPVTAPLAARRELLPDLETTAPIANGLVFNLISPPRVGRRISPPSKNFCVVLGAFATDRFGVNRVLHNPTIGDEARGELGTGTIQIVLDTRKNAHAGKTWIFFEADDGATKLQAQAPSYTTAHNYLTSNCGEQPYILADLYDQSRHITRADKAILIRYTLRFQTIDDMKAALHHMYLVDGTSMVNEWMDKECRFYRGPTTAPYKVTNPNAMDVTHIEGREVREGRRPLAAQEEDDEFGEEGVQYGSQPLW